jgi:GNAT superfamily N-acetyltransferase
MTGTPTIRLAEVVDLNAMHAILTLCGEYMHRAQAMHHWHPYSSFERWSARVDPARVYAVYDGDFLIGTFNLNDKPRDYQSRVAWANPAHRAVYFGGFGLLPMYWGGGLGKYLMAEVDAIAVAGGYDAIRFDGVASNAPLMRFYAKLGYEERGLLDLTPAGWKPIMNFERVWDVPVRPAQPTQP